MQTVDNSFCEAWTAIEDMNNDDSTPEESNNDYKQCVADNVDATVTGKGTFHEMGTLGAETFASEKIGEISAFREQKLSRISQNRIFRVLKFREFGQNSRNS